VSPEIFSFVPINPDEDKVKETKVKCRKSVRFSSMVFVVLVPKLSEYKEAGICHLIWWGRPDYKEFDDASKVELKAYMAKKLVSAKEAARALYQPSEEPKKVEVKPSSSPVSVVPTYEGYLSFIGSPAQHFYDARKKLAKLSPVKLLFSVKSIEEVMQSKFEPVRGTTSSGSVMNTNTDDCWLVPKYPIDHYGLPEM